MPFTVKSPNGQLPLVKATLYTVPALTQTVVKSITLVNTDSATRTMNLYLSSGTSRRLIPKDLTLLAGEVYEYDLVTMLSTTNIIQGEASVANVIDYVINLVEET